MPSQTDIRLLSASLVQAQNKDAAYYSQLRTDDAVEWSGFNSLKDRAQVDAHRPKTLCVFGPLIDSPPAHPATVLTTMAYIDRTTKGLGITHVHITLDMQLYIIACLIQWSNALRWQSIVLPSHRRSCCRVRRPVRRADIHQTRKTSRGTEWYIDQP